MEKAVETAYKAVMKPKEGTILTVAKEAALKASEIAPEAEELEPFFHEVFDHAEYTLSRTPEMLPVLKEAGVVDSGGQGLLEVLRGAIDGFLGKEVDYSDFKKPGAAAVTKISPQAEADIKFGYCTEFIILLDKPMPIEEEHSFKEFLTSIGDSIVLVADDEIVKVHVHTNHPGQAFERALTYGALSRMKIDNMREEHQEKLIKDAEQQVEEEKKQTPPKETGFIAVSAGAGLTDIFRELGVDYLIEGGQTMNPSTEDMLNAIDKVNAKTIYILPNNKNIILAANQARDLTEDKKIIVIPTKTIPQGVTALISFVPEKTDDENTAEMTDAISRVQTGQITYAVRDTRLDDKEIHEGDIMGIGDKGILAVGNGKENVAVATVDAMMTEDAEVISIYYGADASEEKAEELGVTPKVKIEGYAIAGFDAELMGYSPKISSEKLADKLGLDLKSIDMFEINEAFASQAYAVSRDLGLDPEKVNIYGGGISIGHPIGATGAMLTVKVMYELMRTDKKDAMISMCIGGGQGISMYFTKCEA